MACHERQIPVLSPSVSLFWSFSWPEVLHGFLAVMLHVSHATITGTSAQLKTMQEGESGRKATFWCQQRKIGFDPIAMSAATLA